MKGYKGTKADMTCRGFQYELGKIYIHKGDVEALYRVMLEDYMNNQEAIKKSNKEVNQ